MNVQLNNQLVKAVNFFQEDEKEYVSQINYHNNEIIRNQNSLRFIKHPEPPTKEMEMKQMTMILLLLFVWPVGIIYAIYYAKNKTILEKEANDKYNEELKAYEDRIKKITETIEEEKKLLSECQTKRQLFYKTKGECILFLPKPYRNLKAAKWIYDYIHGEYVFTLNDAIARYLEDMKELREMGERAEERENEERRHKEMKKAVDNAAYYQQKTAEELQRIREERYKKW